MKTPSPSLLTVSLAVSVALLTQTGAATAQALSGDIKNVLVACVNSPTQRAKAPLNDEVARTFQTTFSSTRQVYAEAKVIRPLKVKGCFRVALTLSMPGVTVKATTGEDIPVAVNGEMNMCIDGSMPTQEQLK